MDNNTVLILGAILVAVVVVVGVVLSRGRRSARLRTQFGPEYSRTVEEAGRRGKAETQLHQREKRVHRYEIIPLTANERARFKEAWRNVQARFVENPKEALAQADDLVTQVMVARGYPMADFDQRADDLSVDHAGVVQNYRAAHDIAVRGEQGQASTEDLRQATIHYRELFDELADEPAQPRAKAS